MRAALDWVLGHRRKILVEAPRGVLAEYRRHEGNLYIHLVNMRDEPSLNVRVHVQVADGAEPVTATLESPDPDGAAHVETVVSGHGVQMIIAELDVYAVLVVRSFFSNG